MNGCSDDCSGPAWSPSSIIADYLRPLPVRDLLRVRGVTILEATYRARAAAELGSTSDLELPMEPQWYGPTGADRGAAAWAGIQALDPPTWTYSMGYHSWLTVAWSVTEQAFVVIDACC